MATHSSILARRILWTEEPGGLLSIGSPRVGHDWSNLACIGEGNGNPLQYSCLENPRDGEAWWAAVYGVAQGQTRLKRLSSSSSSPFCRVLSLVFYFQLPLFSSFLQHSFFPPPFASLLAFSSSTSSRIIQITTHLPSLFGSVYT